MYKSQNTIAGAHDIADAISIFLIEDNLADVRLMEYALKNSFAEDHYLLKSANLLIDGIREIEKHKTQVVLLDLNLPDSRGLDTLLKFRSVYPSLPVIILTGVSDTQIGKEAIRMGAQDFIVKGEISDSMLRKVIDFSIERQQINMMLYEQDYKYRYIFDNSLDAIFITAKGAKRFINFNVSLQRLLGYDRAELFEQRPQDLFKDPERFDDCKDLFLSGGFISNHELELIHKSGSTIYCLLNLNDVRNINQQIVGIQGIITDITSIKQQKQKLLVLNQQLETKVAQRTSELMVAKRKVEEKNKQVEASIDYAQNIQNALLPTMADVKTLIHESFVLFKPRDIVSGDFYWINKVGKKVVFIVADCTGHGVPGAFMSFIGVQQLNEIVCEKRQTDPGVILLELNHRVNKLLKKDHDSHEIHEGMDIGVCTFNFDAHTLEFASARRPLYIVRDGDLSELKGTPTSIGEAPFAEFDTKKILLSKNDSVFLFTDGYADQIGGSHNKKFMVKRFRSLLLNLAGEPASRQKHILDKTIEEWRGNEMQIDDICGIGVKIH